ncbi:MAG TPA: hypothetical protein VKK31_17715 [Thermoanaerobaculia bacterium]|nr:hypothetical protein [Thermoanaerobaculia bacterium]
MNSFARAILYNTSNGDRAYNTQVILGHRVYDIDSGVSIIYQGQIVSDIGYANSFASHLEGTWGHCYGAGMVVHVNSDNLHVPYASPVDCIELPEPLPDPDPPDENCPILLDLRQDGFHLSGPNPAVSFDIDADGIPDRIAWTKAGEDEAFLCLDRNHNGVIDDGSELFGFATPLLSGRRAKIGYRALAELDLPALGGNNDGTVDAGDSSFADLCAWVDGNRDGVSQTNEIRTLPQVGVVRLQYHYRTIHLTDPSGNLFRYVSSVLMRSPSGAIRSWPTFDVIFTEP